MATNLDLYALLDHNDIRVWSWAQLTDKIWFYGSKGLGNMFVGT